MPITDTNTRVYNYPMAKKGVNLYKSVVDLNEEECIFSQNMVWNNGMVKRGGQTLYSSSQVVASNQINGLHAFYYGTSSKQVLAASGTTVKYYDGAAWQNVKTGLTNNQIVLFTTWLNAAYACNATDAPFKWNGATLTALTAAPANTTQFLPYQDRLLSITGGDLTWSGSFDDTTWTSIANCGVRPDSKLYGMAYHSSTNISSGYQAKILLAGANGMYLFSGTDLRVPYTTGNYSLYPLAINSGCNAPRTMCWTPQGTIWLGMDKQIYLLSFFNSIPIPIGHKIQSNIHLAGITGIEDIAVASMQNSCAVYHDGFYKLSVPDGNNSFNSTQWWLDINRLEKDGDGLYGPWYGPMIGQSLSCFASQNGYGDTGVLLAGESKSSIGGYVYNVHQSGVYHDNTAAINLYYQSYYHALGADYLRKDIHRMEVELRDVIGSVTVDFFDIQGALQFGKTIDLSNLGIYWNDYYWNDVDWSSSMPVRQVVDLIPAIQPRRLSLIIKTGSNNDTFEIYALRVEATEQSAVFA